MVSGADAATSLTHIDRWVSGWVDCQHFSPGRLKSQPLESHQHRHHDGGRAVQSVATVDKQLCARLATQIGVSHALCNTGRLVKDARDAFIIAVLVVRCGLVKEGCCGA